MGTLDAVTCIFSCHQCLDRAHRGVKRPRHSLPHDRRNQPNDPQSQKTRFELLIAERTRQEHGKASADNQGRFQQFVGHPHFRDTSSRSRRSPQQEYRTRHRLDGEVHEKRWARQAVDNQRINPGHDHQQHDDTQSRH